MTTPAYRRLAQLRRFSAAGPAQGRGHVDTLYFDTDDWAIRFFTIGRPDESESRPSPLVSPLQTAGAAHGGEVLTIEMTHDPYELAQGDRYGRLPSDVTQSITSRYELPEFWGGSRVWGDYATPAELRDAPTVPLGEPGPAPELHPHTVLMGRPVFAPDGRLGVVSDLLIDLDSWRIRYFIVWLQAPGETGEVLLSPFWVSGPPRGPRVTVPMTTEAIVSAPTFMAEELRPLDEQILASYFGFLLEQ